MSEQIDVDARLLMLEHVTSSIWANFIANSGGNTVQTCQRVARQSLDALDTIYDRRAGKEPNPNLHELTQRILHHEEGFWKQVEEQVRLRSR